MKSKKVLGRCLLVLLCIVVAIAIIGVAQFYHRSEPEKPASSTIQTTRLSPATTAISAHRSGAGDFPEETLAAFRGCVENPDVAGGLF